MKGHRVIGNEENVFRQQQHVHLNIVSRDKHYPCPLSFSCISLWNFPLRRKLYWTDRGSDNGVPPKVGSADMDGGNLRNLYTGNMVKIGFIAADISARKLYWGVAGSGVVCTVRVVGTVLLVVIPPG